MENKKFKNRTELSIFIAAVLAVLVALNYLSTRYFTRIDMTESKQYSVSEPTKRALRELNDLVNVRVFLSKNLPSHMHQTVATIKDLLSEYKAYSGPNLRITYEDPADDQQIRQAAQSLGIPEVQIQSFDRDKAQVMNGYLGLAILFEDRSESIPVIQNLHNLEYDLTQAIMRVVRTEVPTVGVLDTEGNSMPMPQMHQQDPNPPSSIQQLYTPLFEGLKENYTVETVELSDGNPVDSKIRTLIVPGGSEFDQKTLYALDQFFMRGGEFDRDG
ncbi:GldG family protein [Chitinispirillales bacterium ANBcel5]|uniref:GldG family protein n=1 Tax=Cellulosispirillum alkaliphilum TaxID=3039283 RepID=UPI002A50A2BD|nr:GldG family protein [Chitinispirillales bacterium ANBcel5]